MIEKHLAALRIGLRDHRHCISRYRLSELEQLLELIEQELERCGRHCFTPASARILAYLEGSSMSATTFPSGATIDLVGEVKNRSGVDIPNAVTWTADQGTLSVDPANPEHATLVNAPDGDVTVTMTTTPGVDGSPIVVQHVLTLADLTPASADFTATAG